jgi:hypothetical protein
MGWVVVTVCGVARAPAECDRSPGWRGYSDDEPLTRVGYFLIDDSSS